MAVQGSGASIQQEIIASLFSKRSQEDGALEESYISHLKIWEDDEQGRKPRFLMLASSRTGRCFIHKAKRNSNMTFSKGKTWNLEDLRLVDVIDPLHFSLTMSKTYRWETEREREQAVFLEAVVKTYKGWVGKLPRMTGFTVRSEPEPRAGDTLPAPSYPLRRPSHDSTASSGGYGGGSDAGGSQYSGSQYSNSPYPPTAASPLPSRPRPAISSSRSPASSYSGQDPNQSSRNGVPSGRSGMSNGSNGRENGGGGGAGRRSGDEPRGMVAEPRTSSESASSSQGMGRTTSNNALRAPIQPSPLNPSASPKPSTIPLRSTTPTRQMSTPTPKISITIPRGVPPPQPKSSLDVVQPSPSIRVSPSPTTSRPKDTLPVVASSPSRSSSPQIPKPPSPAPPAAPSSIPPSVSIPLSKSSSANSLAPPSSNGAAPAPTPSTSRSHRKLSLLPPPLQTSFSRDLLLSDDPLTPAGVDDGEDVILANVEEMLEGWDWSSLTSLGAGGAASSFGIKNGKGEMERRLVDELGALEAANIHSFLEADERVALVLEHIDRAILQLDETDAKIMGYKMQLNAVSDDISYIESQNRGLQVQTSNQKALLAELENLLQIVNVDKQDLMILTQESLESDRGVQALESAASSLYKALQAGKDTAVGDMAAAIERIAEYQTHNSQFTTRISDYLYIMFKFQSEMLLTDKDAKPAANPVIKTHLSMEKNLVKYAGLILYIKELDEDRYQKLCAGYFGVASDLHKKEMKDVLMAYIAKVKKTNQEEAAESFVTGGSSNQGVKSTGALARSKTMAALRSPMDVGRKDKKSDSDMKASGAFERAFTQIANMVYREETFISSFLHINSEEATFADYMGLESYFRRQAARFAANGMGPGAQKLVRSAMDLIFGFLAPEMKGWIDGALQRDQMQIVGIMAACERFLTDAEDRNIDFMVRLFQKQLQRLTVTLDQFIASQVKSIEGTKITIKKRKGVAPFVKHFPVFIDLFESQLVGTDGLEIRSTVDASYEKIANAMFESLQQLAKMDGAEGLAPEDKGQLNYHVILIENMHFFVAEMSQQNPATFQILLARAQGIYRENMDSYVRLVVRKPLARMIDFVEGVERIITSSSANDVATNSQYNKVALKRVVKEFDGKDMRKTIETLYKRIHKHFDQSSSTDGPSQTSSTELVHVVADEAQGELCSIADRFSVLISRCYADAGITLDFSSNDIAAAFKKAKAGL